MPIKREGAEDFELIGATLLRVEEKGYAKVTEAALILKLHPATVRHHLDKGLITSTRLGFREVILLEELQRYIQAVESHTLHKAASNPPSQNPGRLKATSFPPDTTKFNL